MTTRRAPYTHSDGSNCWTKNCSLGHIAPASMAEKIRAKINALFETPVSSLVSATNSVPPPATAPAVPVAPLPKVEAPETISEEKIESYLSYGFKEVNRTDYLQNRGKSNFRDSVKESMNQFDSLSPVEGQAVQLYTYDNDYKWINNALYTKNVAPAPEGPYKTLFPYSWDKEESPVTYPGYKHAGSLKEVCSVLDSAIKKAPKKEKVVYRGISSANEIFQGLSPQGFIDKNLEVGKEINFKGYLSSSLDPESALKHSKENNGLIFEIKTEDGLNISYSSDFQEEQEVLLPRNTTYKVVGVHREVKQYSGTLRNVNVIQLVPVTKQNSDI